MKKLSKNLNSRKENLESYNLYTSCDCECYSYCKGNSQTNYRSMKRLQGFNSMND